MGGIRPPPGLSRVKVKRAQYIQKNCEILQEFSFAHPLTKFKVYQIFNSHFYGSPLFDVFGRECQMLEKSYNVSIRMMFDLPRETHCFYIEKITDSPHLRSVLINSPDQPAQPRYVTSVRQGYVSLSYLSKTGNIWSYPCLTPVRQGYVYLCYSGKTGIRIPVLLKTDVTYLGCAGWSGLLNGFLNL